MPDLAREIFELGVSINRLMAEALNIEMMGGEVCTKSTSETPTEQSEPSSQRQTTPS